MKRFQITESAFLVAIGFAFGCSAVVLIESTLALRATRYNQEAHATTQRLQMGADLFAPELRMQPTFDNPEEDCR